MRSTGRGYTGEERSYFESVCLTRSCPSYMSKLALCLSLVLCHSLFFSVISPRRKFYLCVCLVRIRFQYADEWLSTQSQECQNCFYQFIHLFTYFIKLRRFPWVFFNWPIFFIIFESQFFNYEGTIGYLRIIVINSVGHGVLFWFFRWLGQ